MEITEEKLYAALGVTPEEGENDPEAAEQEPGETEQQENNEPEADEENPEEGENDPEAAEQEPGEQSPEERRANAARRREQERQDAINAAVQQALAERDEQEKQRQAEFFQRAAIVNPFTKQPITNMDEFNEWREEHDKRKLQKELQEGRLTKETLEGIIDEHPTMKAVKEAQEQARLAAEQQNEEAMRQEIERQLAEIRKTDPSIKTIADLMNKPYSAAFYAAVQRGNNFEDAFYLATRDQKEQATTEAARQAAINNLKSKSHLKTTNIGGRAGATVTSDEMKMFKLFNPNATEDQIQRYQNKYKQG